MFYRMEFHRPRWFGLKADHKPGPNSRVLYASAVEIIEASSDKDARERALRVLKKNVLRHKRDKWAPQVDKMYREIDISALTTTKLI